MRDGADHVGDARRRPRPLHATVLGATAAVERRPRRILRAARRRARHESAVRVEEQVHPRLDDPIVERGRGVLALDVDGHLGHDVARVRLRRHVMQRHAGARLSVDEHPVHRSAAAIRRQQRSVQVHGRDARQPQQGRPQQPAVPDGHEDIGGERRECLRHLGRVGRGRREDGHPVLGGQRGYRLEPTTLAWVVRVRDHRRDRFAARVQRLEHARAEGVIGEEDDARPAHALAHCSSSATT